MQDENVIVLRAVFGKQQGPLVVTPVKDLTTGRYLGVQNLSEEEKRLSKRAVSHDTSRKLIDNLTFDLTNEVDRIDWAWIKENKEICMSREETLDNPSALFYVDQPDKIIDDRAKKFNKTYEAMKLIEESSAEQKEELCRYLGQNVSSFRPKEIQDYLISKVQDTPDLVLNASKDKYYKEKIFLYRLLDKRKLTKDKSGIIKYGDIIVGLNIDAAISWLNDTRNRDLVGKLYVAMYGEDTSASGSSVISDFESLDKKSAKNKAGKSGKAGKAAKEEDESEEDVVAEALRGTE